MSGVPIVNMFEAKCHLRVDSCDEDDTILALCLAAGDYLARIGCDTAADPVPPSLKLAALLLVGHWFFNREAADRDPPAEIALGVSALTAPLREVSFG